MINPTNSRPLLVFMSLINFTNILSLSFLLRVEPTRPPRPIRAHPTTESESSTPLVVPAPEGVETSVFPYPYIAAGSLAALLLLLLLCLLLLLLLRRCRRRRRSEPGKFDAEAFANALYDKGGLPPPAYVVADIDEVPDYFISQNVNRFNSLNAYTGWAKLSDTTLHFCL